MKVIEEEKCIRCDELLKYDNVCHLYTKKPFNLDTHSNKMFEQIKELEEMANYKFKKVIVSHQTHSTNITVVDDNTPNIVEDNDGLITNLKDVAILTVSADCQNIILFDPVNEVIGNIHAGWRGTLNRILDNAISIMTCEFSSKPNDILAFISPSILKCCFEVDEDLVNNFKLVFNNINDLITKGEIKDNKQKYYIDLQELNKRVLKELGLKESNIYVSNICTKCNTSKFYSHRGDKLGGRNVSLICLK